VTQFPARFLAASRAVRFLESELGPAAAEPRPLRTTGPARQAAAHEPEPTEPEPEPSAAATPQPAAPQPTAAPATAAARAAALVRFDEADVLRKLGDLHRVGVLSDREYQEKIALVGRMVSGETLVVR
jgi:hypothetical protein